VRRKQDQTRQRIIDAAYELFWRAGFARTSIDSIAARSGLTKRTLYSYFRSKDDLLAAVLSHHGDLAMQRLRRIGDRMPTDPHGMIDSFFGQLAGWATVTPRWSGSGFTRLVVELADLPGHPARAIARKAKAITESWLAGRLAQARVARPKARARDIMLLMEGSMALMLIHGDRSYIDAASQAAKRLLREQQASPSVKKLSAARSTA
jgi:AcrR family transcriptional regulator